MGPGVGAYDFGVLYKSSMYLKADKLHLIIDRNSMSAEEYR